MNWNVYKVFRNGKRAKAPITTFKSNEDEQTAYEYFESEIKKNFNEKFRGWEFILLPESAAQERAEEQTNKAEEEALKNQTRVLGRLLREKSITSKHRVVGGLIFASATYWKWQWCALEAASNNFIAGLSPRFDNAREAHAWMNQQISLMNSKK